MKAFFTITLLMVSTILLFGPVTARAQSQSPDTMECIVANDFYMIHFSAFQQPSVEEIKEKRLSNYGPHCQDIPKAGMTAMTVDLFDRDVRTMPISVRLVEEEAATEQGPGAEIRVLEETPAKIYDKGILEMKANLDSPGHYALLLTVGEEFVTEDDRIRIPLRVGLESESESGVASLALLYSVAIVLIILAVFAFFRYSGRKKNGE